MADHRELSRFRATAMDVPIASPHRPTSRAEISARHVDQRFTESGAPGLVADERCENVAFLQEEAAGYAHRFLALADINSAGNQTAPVKTGELLLENPRLEHDAECLEIFLVPRFFRFGSAAFRRLKHLR